MTTKIWQYAFLLLIVQPLSAQILDTIIIQPQLTKATLYYNSAQLTKSALLRLPEGEHLLCIEQVPTDVSMQFGYIEGMKIQRSESASTAYLSIYQKRLTNNDTYNRITKLRQQVDSIQLLKSNYIKGRENTYEEVLKRWSLAPSNALTTTALEDTYKAMTTFAEETRRQEAAFDQQSKNFQTQLKTLQNPTNIQNPSLVLLLTVNCKKSVNDTLHIEYVTREAYWEPSYEAHIADIDKPTNLQLFAKIMQNSNTDWKNVQLVLVSRPYEPSATDIDEQQALKTVVVNIRSRNDQSNSKEIPIFVRTSRWTKIRADRSCLNEDPEKCKVWGLDTTYQLQKSFIESRRVLNNLFDLKKNSTIRHPLAQADTIPTRYQFSAYSRLSNQVYLTAYLKNWQQYNLPSGSIDVYFEGFLVNKTQLTLNTTAEEIPISLGKVDGVYVERTTLTDNYKQTDATGNTHSVDCSYKVRVMNNRKKPIKFNIYDRIPISSTAEIVVKPKTLSGATLQPESGIITWDIEAMPKVPITLAVEYGIDYPKGVTMELNER